MVLDPSLAEDDTEYIVDGVNAESYFQWVPDYLNRDVTNLIPTLTPEGTTDLVGRWTADRTGYVSAGLNYDKTSSGSLDLTSRLIVNGRGVSGVSQTLTGNPDRLNWSDSFPVVAGDIVEIRLLTAYGGTLTTANAAPVCFYYPLRFVKVPKPVVELTGDYSLAEQPVFCFDNGIYRQKTWIDGKPIWQRGFQGKIAEAAKSRNYLTLINGGIGTVIDAKGWWQGQTYADQLPVNSGFPHTDNTGVAATVYTSAAANNLNFMSVCWEARDGVTNCGYCFSVQYTKL
jgi:hypothetical protein